MREKTTKLIYSIIICQLAGFVGSFFTFSSLNDWYETLPKPALQPPNWIFSPVWITLYLLMGISFYLIWARRGVPKLKAITFFWIQLALNIIWPAFFFGLRAPGVAFIDIILMLIAIAATIFYFRKISRPAAWLLVPYFAWVCFASYLNLSIYLAAR